MSPFLLIRAQHGRSPFFSVRLQPFDFGLAFYKSFYPNGDWFIITLRRNYDNVRFLDSLNMRFAQVLYPL